MPDFTPSAWRFNLQGCEAVISKEINGLHLVQGVIEHAARCETKRSSQQTRRKHFLEPMSQHSSLRAVGTTGAKRNVLKRFERVALLKKRGQWKDGDRVSGLRKTRPEI